MRLTLIYYSSWGGLVKLSPREGRLSLIACVRLFSFLDSEVQPHFEITSSPALSCLCRQQPIGTPQLSQNTVIICPMDRGDDLYRVQCRTEHDRGRHGVVGGTKSMQRSTRPCSLLCMLKVRRSVSPSCGAKCSPNMPTRSKPRGRSAWPRFAWPVGGHRHV